MSATIRPYHSTDRRAVRDICIAAGVRGRAIGELLDHPDLWADIWTDYYVTREPDNCYVACDAGRVVGYLLAAADTRSADRFFATRVLPRVAARAILCGHWLSGKDRAFFSRAIESARTGQLALPPELAERYPAHFHFNLLAGHRGQGLGGRMYDLFEQRMRALGVPGLHGQVLGANELVVAFHLRRGYTEVFRQPVGPLSYYLEPGPVELAVFVKRL